MKSVKLMGAALAACALMAGTAQVTASSTTPATLSAAPAVRPGVL